MHKLKALFSLIFQNMCLKNLHSCWNHEQKNIDLGGTKSRGKKTKMLVASCWPQLLCFFHWFCIRLDSVSLQVAWQDNWTLQRLHRQSNSYTQRCLVALQTVEELSDALAPVWEESPRTPSVVSLGACPNIVGHACKHMVGHTNYWHYLSFRIVVLATNLLYFFPFDFESFLKCRPG